MKTFFKKLWEWIKKSVIFIFTKLWSLICFLWAKITTFIKKFNYKLQFVSKGIKGDNTETDKTWIIIPTIYGRKIEKIIEVGIMWFGVGIKIVITKKPL